MKNCQISGPGVSGLLTGVCLHTLILLEMYSVSNAFSFQFSRGTAEQKVQNWWSGHPKCDNFNATHNLWWQKDSDNKIKMTFEDVASRADDELTNDGDMSEEARGEPWVLAGCDETRDVQVRTHL